MHCKTPPICTVAILLLALFVSCSHKQHRDSSAGALRETRSISVNGVRVDILIDKPAFDTLDVMLVFHGTVQFDSKILEAAYRTLEAFKSITLRDDIMIVSVAYPEEGLLMGDAVREAEAALLWVKQEAGEVLNLNVRKIYLAGHSQGGYIVTRLNTMHETDGVIANGAGPLNLVYRCQLEENKQIPDGITCGLLRNAYGTTSSNPDAYFRRSLLNFTDGFKSDILFVQGLNDSPIQMASWPVFTQQVTSCSTCRDVQLLELSGFGHTALFDSPEAIEVFNAFINR